MPAGFQMSQSMEDLGRLCPPGTDLQIASTNMPDGPAALVFPCDEIWAAVSAELPSGSVEGWSQAQVAYWQSLVGQSPAPLPPAKIKPDDGGGGAGWVLVVVALVVVVAVAGGLWWKCGLPHKLSVLFGQGQASGGDASAQNQCEQLLVVSTGFAERLRVCVLSGAAAKGFLRG